MKVILYYEIKIKIQALQFETPKIILQIKINLVSDKE